MIAILSTQDFTLDMEQVFPATQSGSCRLLSLLSCEHPIFRRLSVGREELI